MKNHLFVVLSVFVLILGGPFAEAGGPTHSDKNPGAKMENEEPSVKSSTFDLNVASPFPEFDLDRSALRRENIDSDFYFPFLQESGFHPSWLSDELGDIKPENKTELKKNPKPRLPTYFMDEHLEKALAAEFDHYNDDPEDLENPQQKKVFCTEGPSGKPEVALNRLNQEVEQITDSLRPIFAASQIEIREQELEALRALAQLEEVNLHQIVKALKLNHPETKTTVADKYVRDQAKLAGIKIKRLQTEMAHQNHAQRPIYKGSDMLILAKFFEETEVNPPEVDRPENEKITKRSQIHVRDQELNDLAKWDQPTIVVSEIVKILKLESNGVPRTLAFEYVRSKLQKALIYIINQEKHEIAVTGSNIGAHTRKAPLNVYPGLKMSDFAKFLRQDQKDFARKTIKKAKKLSDKNPSNPGEIS